MATNQWFYLDDEHESTLPREMEEVECEVSGKAYRAYFMDGMFISAIGEAFGHEEVSRWRALEV